MHGFQVRTPICHIVPVSRAYVYIVEKNEKGEGGAKAGRWGVPAYSVPLHKLLHVAFCRLRRQH